MNKNTKKKELTLADLQDVRGAAAIGGEKCHTPRQEDCCVKAGAIRNECATPAPSVPSI